MSVSEIREVLMVTEAKLLNAAFAPLPPAAQLNTPSPAASVRTVPDPPTASGKVKV